MARNRTPSRSGLPTHLKILAAALLFGFTAETLASPPPGPRPMVGARRTTPGITATRVTATIAGDTTTA